MIKDSYNRIHNYLRISLTDNCNLRCSYCMPEEDYLFTPVSKLMQVSEIETLAKVFVSEGVNKIRLTGGEPLVRKDAAEIMLSLSKLPVQLTLTTNGTRLHKFFDVLMEANIRSLNISLDTLQSNKFNLITQRDQFDIVWKNIQHLVKNNFHVKVNVVVMKNINDNEIKDFIAWTKNTPVHVRFIEFMPFSGNGWTSNRVVTLQQILDTISQGYSFIPIPGEKHDTAKKFVVPGRNESFPPQFCGGKRKLQAILNWTSTTSEVGARSMVTFRYTVVDVPAWVRNPALWNFFWDLKRVDQTREDSIVLVLTKHGWKDIDEARQDEL